MTPEYIGDDKNLGEFNLRLYKNIIGEKINTPNPISSNYNMTIWRAKQSKINENDWFLIL